MTNLEGKPFHRAQFASIRVTCEDSLQEYVTQHFDHAGFNPGEIRCYSVNLLPKLTVFFEMAKQSKELAQTIMGLFNRNDIEVEMHCCTGDDPPQIKTVRLRKSDDVEACERLLDKCAALNIKMRENRNSDSNS